MTSYATEVATGACDDDCFVAETGVGSTAHHMVWINGGVRLRRSRGQWAEERLRGDRGTHCWQRGIVVLGQPAVSIDR